MARDLRSFLKEYEASHPELILHLKKEIRANQEVTALVVRLEKEEKYPVVICENIITCAGNKSPFPLITNLLASRTRCAEAIGSTFRTVHLDFYKKARQNPVPPQVISKAEAPVKEVVKTGQQVDLTQAPALYH
ncbi:MAG: UbiD family decarboxylase, partial [Dehalococcoidia bacterium]|nr:UbiD family decarboxylase [Dehalococcoidia bacterium]